MKETEFNTQHLVFDKQQQLYFGTAKSLFGGKIPCAHKKVTDEMIKHFLNAELFIDTMSGDHYGMFDTLEHHAQRIASLIHLLRNDVLLKPIEIFYDVEKKEYHIDDGWHRLRASFYLNKPIPFVLYNW